MFKGRFYILTALFIIICAACAPTYIINHQTHTHNSEKYYQTKWCEERGGEIEYALDDYTRVDCLLSDYAIEFDFAKKWAEAIGQALYYGIKTDRKPGIVLIIENGEQDDKYLNRLKVIGEKHNIMIWTTTP